MKTTHLGALSLLVILCACNSSPKAGVTCAPSREIILVDQTIENKSALVKELDGEFENIQRKFRDQSSCFLGGSIELAFVNSNGENESQWKVVFSKTKGFKNRNLSNSIFDLKRQLDGTKLEILADKKVYQQSRIVEAVSYHLSKLGSGDGLVVISDFNVVDEANNFERGHFSEPHRLGLTNGINVELRRVPVAGQSMDRIRLVEAWWKTTLFGENEWAKIDHNDESNSSIVRMNRRAPLKKKLIQQDRSEPASQTLALSARSVLRGISGKLSKCAQQFYSSNDTSSDLDVRIRVNPKGTVSGVQINGAEGGLFSSCVDQELRHVVFARHPSGNYYSINQRFAFGKFASRN